MVEIKNAPGRAAADDPLDSVLRALPYRLSDEIVRLGGRIEEIRVREWRRSSVVLSGRNVMLNTCLERGELASVLSGVCKGSLYAFSDTINRGYIALPSGVRVGVCGHAAVEGDRIIGVHDITSLTIRIPHRIRPVGEMICTLLKRFSYVRGVLIYSPPGVGKTTLLRAVAARLSSGNDPLRTVVIDTRGELSYGVDSKNLCLDVLSGYPRRQGIEIATRSLNAQVIICDEIGDYEEAMALVASHNCGVPLIATAHAANTDQLLARTGIRLLHEANIFGAYVGISRTGNMDFSYDVTVKEDCDRLF